MFDRLKETGIIPVVSINDANDAEALADALYEGGLSCVEITFRTAAAASAIERIRKHNPGIFILAGTVLKTAQAEEAIAKGADLIVAPGLNPQIAAFCRKMDYPYIPGVCTPSEIEMALDLGYDVLKFFPASAMGGLKTIEALHAPYSEVRFMPTGGVDFSSAQDYLKKDFILCVGGSWIARTALIDEKQFAEIRELAAEAAAAVRSVREKQHL